MITHIVLFKFKPETTDAEIQKLAEGLGSLPQFLGNGQVVVSSDAGEDSFGDRFKGVRLEQHGLLCVWIKCQQVVA